ncbi:hypothetical protein [Aquidulcibacter sp.]|jgi:hypothetical protein|uniref:hypothetical protein n=1 Tax=Aquidulcibacter sp. TaxID=2052990 RepID=UPI0028AF25E3|nr:hypothetical protein [Aquidulcibacter sp.]
MGVIRLIIKNTREMLTGMVIEMATETAIQIAVDLKRAQQSRAAALRLHQPAITEPQARPNARKARSPVLQLG